MKSLLRRLARVLPGDLGEEVARGAGVVLSIQVGGAALGYLSHVVLARVLNAAGYGAYAYAMAWLALLAVPAGLGLNTALIRFVAEYREEGRRGLLRGVALRSWQLVIGLGTILALLGSALILWGGDRLTIPYASALLIGLWIVPLRALVGVQEAMARALKRMTLAYLPSQVIRPALLILGIGGGIALGSDLDERHALGLTAVAYLVPVLIQGRLLGRRVQRETAGTEPEYETRRWLRISLPMLLIAGFFLLLKRTDVVMLGILAQPADVGTYNAAAQTASLTGFVLLAVNAIVAPSIAPLFQKGERDRLQDLASTAVHLAFWPSLAVGVGLVLFGPLILGLFGNEFIAGQSVLTILVVSHVVNVGVGSVGYLMNMTGNQDKMAGVVGVAAMVNLILNLLLIPPLGAVGAGVATGASMILWNVWLNRIVVARLCIRPSIFFAIRRLAVARDVPPKRKGK